ncbi:ABC transporter ATP-binding protein [Spirosoma utsteinense]|uniref:Osmoprotectant transport system ATP-binding protein n=1 Tax=Spirosoma utsteinense TaxID=2585773 RepID=A0ABR6W7W3_9BACT|nr:ABC transporter ATP-binding protein [Spirosoma utsteinense]MBC3787736.1 osmoprotectant transport system ATP-binding protein [Spirosoma utsteinense]MBC3792660.1 osmoprotectant transport system ATP-binding protein [Spirosoma utsteinense]
MIDVRNLTKRFGDHTAVNDISLRVGPGETLVLLGTSGCGKTTTLKMMNRLIEPGGGSISVDGVDVAQQDGPGLRRRIGYVIQDGGLFPHYTIAEAIATVPKLIGWTPTQIQERTRELIDKLQLPESLLNRYPAELSGGQRQRVGLARALAARPPVVLMDEPFGALDPFTRRHVRRELFGLNELRETTVVLVTHDVSEALELADRIALMDKGRIVQIGPPDELLNHPATDFVRDFLDDQPRRNQLE